MKTRLMTLVLLMGVTGFVLLTSCSPSHKWEKEEQSMINDFLSARGDTVFEIKPSGLYFHSIQEGTGVGVQLKDTVAIRYTAWFLNYMTLDTNVNAPTAFLFVVGGAGTITGINECVQYMRKGGIAKMITPSSLAWGSYGWPPYFGGYTPFVWKVELVDVMPGPGI